ncbi:hypothetical protein [Nonlabens sp.]|uniref:hypothetical protein n=1 Tax=Nonlabens sp. TaxID=1888209 RepID=UPI003F6A140D
MKVYGKCKSCKNEIGYRTNAHTRVEFAMQDGETKKMNCKNCGTNTEFHVDELFAKRSNMPYLIVALGVLLLVIITLYFLFFSDSEYVILAFGLPFVVYFILTKQDQTRVSDFNNRKLKGRTHNIG